MQRVTNCILVDNHHILLLKKPRRGWYAIPGGKMEQGETIKEAVVREYQEETNLQLRQPRLAGIFTFSIFKNDRFIQEWMMFTFIGHSFDGTITDYCDEGKLEWVPIESLDQLPMAEGDRKIFKHILSSEEMVYGAFSYTDDFQLLDLNLDDNRNQGGE